MSTPEVKPRKSRQHTRGQKILVNVLLLLFICVLICVLMLSVLPRRVKRYALVVKQKAQLSSIDVAIELFNSEFGGYPPSGALDESGAEYCGAMKLCEAVMGQDLLGFHPDAVFRSDGTDGEGKVLYPTYRGTPPIDFYEPRKGPYLMLDNANAYSLANLYGEANTGSFDPNHFVLCDIFRTLRNGETVKRFGMPILYYKADTSKTAHDITDPNNPENIYDYKDNHALLALGVPGKAGLKHPMYEDPRIFYEITWNAENVTKLMPHGADTFILLSAGPDGLYGTPDDIANFEWKWKRK